MASIPPGVLGALDPTSDRAAFRQIADQLREAIDKGRFKEGAKLPSESELVEHYGKTRMTVRNALGILQGEGLTVHEHGRGVFVRPRPPVKRLASDRFARRHRDQGKAAFVVEAEAAGSHSEVDSLEVTSIYGDVIHENLHNSLHHITENTQHTSLKCCRCIA